MSFFSVLFGGVKKAAVIVEKALGYATHAVDGPLHDYVHVALSYIEEAATQIEDNDKRREWVVRQLVTRVHLPESVARLVLELAYQVYKHESK